MGKTMWDRIYMQIRKNPESLQGIKTWFKGVASLANHPMKMMAPVVGGTVGFQKGKANTVYEHARPASDTYNVLLNAGMAFSNKKSFDAVFDLMMLNYKVIGLANQPVNVNGKNYDNPVDAVYPRSMPPGVTEWFRRYANPAVAKVDGGVNVNSLYLFNQGKVFSDAFQIDAAGKPLTKQGKVIAAKATKKQNTLIKGKKAYAKNPNLKPSLPDSAKLDTDINNMIQDTKGIEARKRFSDIVAKRRGAGVKSFRLIAAGAQDFNGLMYDLFAKGKKGEQQQKWVKDNLVKPYQKGIAEIDQYRMALKNDYSSLLKNFPKVSKKLGKTIDGTDFTFDQALRVNLWTQGGFEIPGLSKRDIKKLNDVVNKDPELKSFTQAALEISK